VATRGIYAQKWCWTTSNCAQGVSLFSIFDFSSFHRAHYGTQTNFPLLEPTKRPRPKRTTDEPIKKYFDSKAEHRQLGTAFYALSSNPEERQRQQEELRARKEETKQARTTTTSLPNQQLSAAKKAIEALKRPLQSKKEELAPKRMKKTDASSAGPAPLS
jgi:hypothetical protein